MAEALAPFTGVLGSILETLKVSKIKLDTMNLRSLTFSIRRK